MSNRKEEQVRMEYGPDNERNQAAIKTIKIIDDALEAGETGPRIDFRVYVGASPFFASKLFQGGMSGLDVEIGCLEKREGELVYHERELGLRWKSSDFSDPAGVFGFINTYEAGRYEYIDFYFFPKQGSITKDPETGKIELQGVRITG